MPGMEDKKRVSSMDRHISSEISTADEAAPRRTCNTTRMTGNPPG
jgi:hypothetical protein